MKNTKQKIPMNITIETHQTLQNPQGESVSESARTNAIGFLKKTRYGLELEYLEKELPTINGRVTTVSMLNDNIITVNRFGFMDAYMVFEEGKAHTCIYDAEPLPLQLNIRTNKLQNSISPQGGRLDIDYTVQIAGSTAEHSHISMSVSPHESIITS